MIYEADQQTVQHLHGRGAGLLVLVISLLALLFFGAAVFNLHGFADRFPWRGSSSDPVSQKFVVRWNRVLSVPFLLVTLVVLVKGLQLVVTGGSM
jgi:hypothetical protein